MGSVSHGGKAPSVPSGASPPAAASSSSPRATALVRRPPAAAGSTGSLGPAAKPRAGLSSSLHASLGATPRPSAGSASPKATRGARSNSHAGTSSPAAGSPRLGRHAKASSTGGGSSAATPKRAPVRPTAKKAPAAVDVQTRQAADALDQHRVAHTDEAPRTNPIQNRVSTSPLLGGTGQPSGSPAAPHSPLSPSKGFFAGVAGQTGSATVSRASSGEVGASDGATAQLAAALEATRLSSVLRADLARDIAAHSAVSLQTPAGDSPSDAGGTPGPRTFSSGSLSVNTDGRLLLRSILKRRHLPPEIQGSGHDLGPERRDGSYQEIPMGRPLLLTRSVSHSTGIDRSAASGNAPGARPNQTRHSGLVARSQSFSGSGSGSLSRVGSMDSSSSDESPESHAGDRAAHTDSDSDADVAPEFQSLAAPPDSGSSSADGLNASPGQVARSLGSLARINFCNTVEVLPTFKGTEYNRKPEANVTFRQLTPQLKVQIREELNEYKRREMSVHELSSGNTCFH